MKILTRIHAYFNRKARVRRIQAEARTHARRSLYCGLCNVALIQQELSVGYCGKHWALKDENSDGVRALGMPS